MPRLSIVIPNASFDSLVEDTLVSVLQHRPEYSEIVVVTSQPYADPYGLGREVRFLNIGPAVDQIDLINRACEKARGDVIHLLLPGTRVTDGWTDGIWQYFADDSVGCVSPVLLASETASRAAGVGVTYFSRGERHVVGKGIDVNNQSVATQSILAPLLAAGFYRCDVLYALQGFDLAMGESLADVEFGLALRDLGLRSAVDAGSHLIATQPLNSKARNFTEARQAEQLFRRHRQPSRMESWKHGLYIAAEMLLEFPRPRSFARVVGRMTARRDADPRVSYDTRLEQARAHLDHRRETTSTIPMEFDNRRIPSLGRLRQAA